MDDVCCEPQVIEEENFGGCGDNCSSCPMGGDPINFATGNTFQAEVDFSASGPGLPMRYVRYYNSRSNLNEYLGFGWTGSFSEALVSVESGKVVLQEADGKHVEFPADGDVFFSETGKARTIRAVGDGHELTEPDGRVLSFDADGRLFQVEDRNGNRQTIGYDETKPSFVSDDFGRRMDFGYDAAGKLEMLTTPVGTFQYGYDGNDNLAQVTQPDGTTREYRYADPNDAHNLTGIVDEAGVEYVAYTYDDQDRAWYSVHAGGLDEFMIDYTDAATRLVVDGNGNSTTHTLRIKKGIAQVSSSTGAGCGTCYASSGVGHEFTSRDQIRTIFDGEGHATRFGFDDRGNVIELTEAADTLETVEQILDGEEPSNAETKRTTTYTWHPDYSLVASVTRKSVDPAHAGEDVTTTYAYDANGNLDTVTETGYSDGALETRVTDYDFDGLGRLTFVDGPRSGVADTFAVQYYPNEAAQGLNRGMPERIVNGLNQATLFRDYNAFGKPERIVDASGVETLLAYDAAGRLAGQNRAGQATAYEYDPTGRLEHVYPPPGTGATRRIDYEYFGCNFRST